MLNPFTWPALGGSLLAAVAFGIHLGQSSIGLIDPIHFQGPAPHPRDRGVAIEEPPVGARAPVYGELYGWEQGRAARAADCGDCEALAARDAHAYSAEVPYFGSREELRAADIRERAARRADEPKYAGHEPEPAAVEEPAGAPVLRYASYPIEEPAMEPFEIDPAVERLLEE